MADVNEDQAQPEENAVETPEVQDGQSQEQIQDAGKDQLFEVTNGRGQVVKVSREQAIRLASQGVEVRQHLDAVRSENEGLKALLARLKDDPESVLSDPKVGLDVKAFAEKYLASKVRDELDDKLLTPEQKELKAFKSERARQEAEKKAADTKAKQEADAKKLDQTYQVKMKEYGDKFVEVINTHGLPQTPGVIERMACLELDAIDRGQKIPAAVLAQQVREEFVKEQELAFEGLDGDALLKAAPKLAEKFRKAELARVQKGNHVAAPTKDPNKDKLGSKTPKKAQAVGSFDSGWDKLLYPTK